MHYRNQDALSADSINLLKTCGIKFDNGTGKLKSAAQNFPLEIFFLRDDDIPQYIADGVADIGIVGENVLAEAQIKVEIIERLGFGKCRLSLAVPKSFDYQSNQEVSTKYVLRPVIQKFSAIFWRKIPSMRKFTQLAVRLRLLLRLIWQMRFVTL
ncbi:MAG: ATP phosphoribosyltransferase [Pyrinomonadaceae bacterium]